MIAWVQEQWVLGHLRGEQPIWPQADALYDSAHVAHDTRWDLPLPARAATLDYMQAVLDRVLKRAREHRPGNEEFYFPCLALLHEDMHGEAFVYMRQALGYPPPQTRAPASVPRPDNIGTYGGDAAIPGGTYWLGAPPETRFVFDNEKWAHAIEVAPFRLARTAVTNAQFAEFVESGGYRQSAWWSPPGWNWRQQAQADRPLYWHRSNQGWRVQHFDRVAPLRQDAPVAYVNWYEADAYCRWARRRLATEAEWELAASTEPGSPGHKRAF